MKWSIYRVPSKLRNVNAAAYTPQLVSIGLFHYGKPELKDMERHKRIYSDNFCKRCWEGKGKVLSPSQRADDLRSFIKTSKQSIIHCYAGTIELNIDEDKVVEVILVDACFIIELFLRNQEKKYQNKDYILSSLWLRKAIELELILFENQLPFSLLQNVYDHVFPQQAHVQAAVHPFLALSCKFFKDFNKGEPRVVFKDFNKGEPRVEPKHFTDLVRSFMVPLKKVKFEETPIGLTYSIRMLTAAGVNFKPAGEHHERLVVKIDGPEPLDENNDDPEAPVVKNDDPEAPVVKIDDPEAPVVKIDDPEAPERVTEKEASRRKLSLACLGSLKLTQATLSACSPSINLNVTPFYVKDDTECIIRNVMALEQFVYPKEAYVCNYFLIMDKLVDTEEDVDFLVENGVIVNMLGSSKEVAKLVNNLCHHIMKEYSCYNRICDKLNMRYKNSLYRHWVSLIRVYFKDPWTGSATVFGVVLVVLTIVEIAMSFRK